MNISTLYTFLCDKTVFDLREKIEEKEDGYIKKYYIDDKAKLEAMLDGAEKEQFKRFLSSMENWFEYLYDLIGTYVLNMGVKIGMELQEAFDSFKAQEII